MKLHTLAGLPRSGSTLLANVLAQHPDITVTGTSPLASAIDAVATVLANAPEIQSDLANVPGSEERYADALRALALGWHSNVDTPIVVDKGRGWAIHRALLDILFPGSITICTVRDPRDVFASIERQHRNTAVFQSPIARTVYEAADLALSPEGLIGGPLRFIEDLIRRNFTSVVFVRYESFARDPATTLQTLSTRLDLSSHTWDFENVVSVATDLDAIYRNKYPHDGSGPIKPTGTKWTDVLSDDLGPLIAGVAPLYMQTFGYE